MYSRLNLNLLLSVDLHSEHRWSCILIKLLPPVLILYQPTGPPLHVADLNYGSRIHSLAVQVLPGSVTLFCAQHVGSAHQPRDRTPGFRFTYPLMLGICQKCLCPCPPAAFPKLHLCFGLPSDFICRFEDGHLPLSCQRLLSKLSLFHR